MHLGSVRYLQFLAVSILLAICINFIPAAPSHAAGPFTCSDTVRIMPTGDSLTQGYSSGVNDNGDQIAYRKTLYDNLIAQGRQINFVGSNSSGGNYAGFDPDHMGMPGWNVQQVEVNIYNWLVANTPDIVLLHIGTNDLNPNPGVPDPALAFIDNYERLLDYVDDYENNTGNNVTVVVARIIRRLNSKTDYNSATTRFNNALESMVNTRISNGDDLILVNMETGAGIIYEYTTNGGDIYYLDAGGIHLAPSGYNKMAAVWGSTLLSLLPNCSVPTQTNTPTPTYTPTRTNTPTPTYTPTRTNTPTPTNTPTRTNTPTPPSPGCTAEPDTIGIFRSSDFSWYLRNSNSAGFAEAIFNYGLPSDKAVTGDWNGDGTDTVGIYRNGIFYLKNSNSQGTGLADITFSFGLATDIPIAGDWNGDGIDTVGLYRPSAAAWYLRNSNTTGGADISFTYGLANETPVTGDWDGDGIDTIGIFRASDNTWYLRNSNSSGFANQIATYGLPSTDIAITGDWDGDCIDTIGLYRHAEGLWLLKNVNSTGVADITFVYGFANERPVTGHWLTHTASSVFHQDVPSLETNEKANLNEDQVTETTVPEPTEEPTVELIVDPTVTVEPTVEPTATVDELQTATAVPTYTDSPIIGSPTAISTVPVVTPTTRPTDVPPTPAVLPYNENFDDVSVWAIRGSWLQAQDCNAMGACMSASTRPRGEISTLTQTTGINLHSVPADYVITMTVWQYAKLASEDIVAYEISTDAGLTWQPLLVLPGMTTEWLPLQIDLSGYAGNTIQLRISLNTQVPLAENTESIGYRIDELRIEAITPTTSTEEPTQSISVTATMMTTVTSTVESTVQPTETQLEATPNASPSGTSTSVAPPSPTLAPSPTLTPSPTLESSPTPMASATPELSPTSETEPISESSPTPGTEAGS